LTCWIGKWSRPTTGQAPRFGLMKRGTTIPPKSSTALNWSN